MPKESFQKFDNLNDAMEVLKKEEEERKEENKPQSLGAAAAHDIEHKSFTRKNAEDLVKAALGGDVFKREEKATSVKEEKEEREKPLRTASEENLENARKELEFAVRNKDEKLISYWTERVKAREEKIKNFSEKKKQENINEQKGPDLTTAEGRQKEIDRIMAEEAAKEEAVNLSERAEKKENEEISGAFEKISAEQNELAEKLLAATEKQEEKIEQEIKQEKSWIREKVEKAADWYKKQPLKYKILFSLGCFGAASASAALGGAVGAAVATAAFTGSAFQRMLGGMATFVAVEGFLKKAAEKGGRERTEWEARRHTLEAAVLGVLVGSGKFAEGIKNVAGMIMPEEAMTEIKEATENIKKSAGLPPEQISPAPKASEIAEPETAEPKAASPKAYIETAEPGDSVWKMAERQLEERYGAQFTGLNDAQKTYIIDAIKDKMAANPQAFGLDNIDELKVGQKIDFSKIFENKDDIEKIFNKGTGLSEAQMENIVKNNETLREWLKNHPGERLTSEKIENILTGKKVVPAPEEIPAKTETPSVETPPGSPPEPPLKASPEVMAQLEKVAISNELTNIKALGFNIEEYKAIQDLKINKLLEQIPSKEEGWAIWRGEVEGKSIDLPHHGVYGFREFGRHIKLAEFIRSFKPDSETQEMTVKEFLRMVGPKGTMSL